MPQAVSSSRPYPAKKGAIPSGARCARADSRGGSFPCPVEPLSLPPIQGRKGLEFASPTPLPRRPSNTTDFHYPSGLCAYPQGRIHCMVGRGRVQNRLIARRRTATALPQDGLAGRTCPDISPRDIVQRCSRWCLACADPSRRASRRGTWGRSASAHIAPVPATLS